jgi:hypothetical protein
MSCHLKELWKIDVCMEIMKTAKASAIAEHELVSAATRNTIASGGTVKDCLGVLVTIGFMGYDRRTRAYKTTQRGISFASIFDELLIHADEEQMGQLTRFSKYNLR